MKPTLPSFRAWILALVALIMSNSTLAAAGPSFHFALAKSEPADGATVRAVTAIRLWFTEAPEKGTVSIHVLDVDGHPLPAADVTRDEGDGAAFSLPLSDALAPGPYRVIWRGMGDDGHVVRGEFDFHVAGAG